MSFIIGLSALNAAQQEISVTGNNIANSSTTGFKSSRTVFGDVYAASVLGGGGTQAGSGVSLQEIKQNFNQGNISFTNSTLDMAINGEGFFVLSGESGVSYTRAGAFGTDRNGFIVTGAGERLQGFSPSPTGQPTGGGPLEDLRVTTGEIPPRATTTVSSVINLDASAQPSALVGTTITSNNGRSSAPVAITAGDALENGYEANSISVLGSDNVTRLIDVAANSSANAVAQQFSAVNGVTARATSVAYLTNFNAGPVNFNIGGLNFAADFTAPAVVADELQTLADSINATVTNVSARVVGGTDLEVTHNTGADLRFHGGATGAGTFDVYGSEYDSTDEEYTRSTDGPVTVDTATGDSVLVGGIVNFTLEENVTFTAATEDSEGNAIDQTTVTGSIFGDISAEDALDGIPFSTNQFDPGNPDTYYRSTAVTIYDSLGNQHSLTKYFVKERPDETDSNNLWSVYLQVDNRNIGYDPNSTDGEPVLARFDLRFDNNGIYDPNQSPIQITNWTPVDSLGRQQGAGPIPGDPNVAGQLTNSNFTIDLSQLTQFGGDFSVQSNNQDGFAKGQLTGLEINDRGLVSARFSNGQSRALGEVALANFSNPAGLSNLGGTKFGETSESGTASVSGAGTAGLGAIQSGALEDSNVDLPAQLVQLIISQRNYQAAAQVISAQDTATQTIINL
ncbi:flagellar hook-basal body complex protein [Pseudohongiella sp.]|uniref:Flagellar hook protein FlgE n=1 Tax=marine sediment metagenome TaxID=412755 RepID=A0A0F9Z387_9ZZZZ|nr:flagellar hook-basal body complex protein [Pseudohongiella sp.]HDZ09153.1 flagellar hook-basal body complex protein [Pseudohongiella sp.]HEA63511.1 flagellar hook-basal body complex protein [Pseudohongiella sp.]